MPIISFGEYRPDVADYEGQHSKDITNAVPHGDGYGPFLAFGAYSTALASACRGMFYALKNDGTVAVFAGTATKLYLLNNTNQTWTDVSQGAGNYTGPPSNRNWSFAQFNNFVLATQVNDNVQVIDLTSPTAFADLGGSPPRADFVTVVNRFVVLSGIATPNVYRVQWSGLNAITTWDNVTNLSNFQDMADGGIVRGVTGGDIGYIFQDRAIRRMIFQPGSSLIFGIDRVSQDDGLLAPYSLVQGGDNIFYCSPAGFKMIPPGGYPQHIGRERVDRTFLADVDQSNLQLMIAAVDPRYNRVYWAYKSVAGAAGLFDKILVYDWVLDRWSLIKQTGQYLGAFAQGGVTLEGVDAAYGQGTPAAASSFTTAGLVTAANTYTAGQGGVFTSSGNLPAWYVMGTPYYVMSTSLTSAHFQVSASGGVGALQGAVQSSTSTTSTSTGTGTLSFAPESIDGLLIPTFDNIATGQLPAFAAVSSSNILGYFNGPPIEATMETAEHGGDGKLIFIRSLRPVTDAATLFGSASGRMREENATVFTGESALNAIGLCPLRISTRYARGKIRIPSGTSWTFAAGIEPIVRVEGQR